MLDQQGHQTPSAVAMQAAVCQCTGGNRHCAAGLVQEDNLPGAAATQEHVSISAVRPAHCCTVQGAHKPISSHTRAVELQGNADQGTAPPDMRPPAQGKRRGALILLPCVASAPGMRPPGKRHAL